ncbi:ATP-grasp domain-containing protein [Oleiagrimonas soli]|uniref:Biotin carboxylase n=1 Tax=Oleiagrimonas soli TaxID=1543381 RepID=A0A099CUD6_9GAMM|nr:ATP-grasp domain-containing protein [Oleiagrimonas soli]KGI77247.1 hypothetical protein LF63_0111685 [Oleiagrimonas soli]MBB6185564.1 biotin carboxylase [Oleiagrimonas soli]
MSKVLLVDTNFSSAPIHDALKSMGHEVHVAGNRPDDCLAKVSRNYWNMDYADCEALASLIDQEQFEFLVPGCTDRSYLSCAAVSNGRFPGIDQHSACEAIFDKAKFRQVAEEIGLPVPRRMAPASAETSGCTAIIVKPVDAFSGKGITVLHEVNRTTLNTAIKHAEEASPSRRYVLEEFVDGQLHSHTACIEDGHIIQDFLVREDSSVNPFAVDTSCVLAQDPTNLRTQLRTHIECLAKHLSLADGLLHTQFIAGKNGIHLIEITRRCPGDLYSQLIELSTGFRYAHAYTLPYLGERASQVEAPTQSEPILRHTVTLPQPQSLAYIRFKRALQIERWTPLSLVGDSLRASPYSRVGVLFCRTDDFEHLEQLYACILDKNLYEVCA